MSKAAVPFPKGERRAKQSALDLARQVLGIEADAVRALASRLDERFLEAVELIHARRGRVVVSGIGKSGHIARKIASTMASTGTPAYFVHPAEASHGDLGMVEAGGLMSVLGSFDEAMRASVSIVASILRGSQPAIPATPWWASSA